MKLETPYQRAIARWTSGAALSLACFASLAAPSHAATPNVFVEFEPAAPVAGAEFIARVFVASDQPLNGYELVVSFVPNDAELIRTDTSRSLIDVWPKQPTVHVGGLVRWSGASIEPFSGERGELLALRLRALPGATHTVVNVSRETALYLANGKGTKIAVPSREFAAQFGGAPSGGPLPETDELSHDTTPPEIPFIALENDPITAGQKFLSFQTNDRESGVAQIEARTRSWFFWSAWHPTRNPDALTAGVWETQVRVTDHAGNVSLAVVRDWRTAGTKIGILLGTVAMVLAALFWTVRSRTRGRKT
jgi:hypothetical protein